MEVIAVDCVAVKGQPLGVPVLVPEVKKRIVSWEGLSWVGSVRESVVDCEGMRGRDHHGEDNDVLDKRTRPTVKVWLRLAQVSVMAVISVSESMTMMVGLRFEMKNFSSPRRACCKERGSRGTYAICLSAQSHIKIAVSAQLLVKLARVEPSGTWWLSRKLERQNAAHRS